jgi:hypothetical protein
MYTQHHVSTLTDDEIKAIRQRAPLLTDRLLGIIDCEAGKPMGAKIVVLAVETLVTKMMLRTLIDAGSDLHHAFDRDADAFASNLRTWRDRFVIVMENRKGEGYRSKQEQG